MQANASRRASRACSAEDVSGGEGCCYGGVGGGTDSCEGCGEDGTTAMSLPLFFSNLLALAMSVEKEAWADFDDLSYEEQLRRRIERDVLPEPEETARWLAAPPRIEQGWPHSPPPPPPPPYPPPQTPPSAEVPHSE